MLVDWPKFNAPPVRQGDRQVNVLVVLVSRFLELVTGWLLLPVPRLVQVRGQGKVTYLPVSAVECVWFPGV